MKIFNEIKFTYLFGEDEDLTIEEIRKKFYGVEEICGSLDELIDKSDAVMILTIPGKSHVNYALKVIEKKKPVFIDKPFTDSFEDAKKIVRAAKENNVPLFGGSTLRQLKKIYDIKDIIKTNRPNFLAIRYKADPESPLGLYHYYGSHLAEVCMALCGPYYEDVSVIRNSKDICSVVKYKDITAILLSSLSVERMNITLFGEKTLSFDIEQDNCYIDGSEKFIGMIKKNIIPVEYDEFIYAVKLIEDISHYLQKR